MGLTSGGNENPSVGADSPSTGAGGAGSPKDGEYRERQLPSGKFIQEFYDASTGTWVPEGSPYAGTKESTAGAGAQPRNDALTAAQAALSGFLQAQSLADARKMAAMDTFQKLGQWAVPNGAQFAPNFEPGGLANEAAAVAGMKNYTPPKLQTAKVNPGSLEQAGQVPPEVMAMLNAVRSAGGAG